MKIMDTKKLLERLRHERDLVGSDTILHNLKSQDSIFKRVPIHCTEIEMGEKWMQLIQGTVCFVYEKNEEPEVALGNIFTEGKINDDWKKQGAVTWDLNESDNETIEQSVCRLIVEFFGVKEDSELKITTKDFG